MHEQKGFPQMGKNEIHKCAPTISRIALHHLIVRLEARLGDLVNSKRLLRGVFVRETSQ